MEMKCPLSFALVRRVSVTGTGIIFSVPHSVPDSVPVTETACPAALVCLMSSSRHASSS